MSDDENKFRPWRGQQGPLTFTNADMESRRAAVFDGDMFSVGADGRMTRENCAKCERLEARIAALREALYRIQLGLPGPPTGVTLAAEALRADDEAAK